MRLRPSPIILFALLRQALAAGCALLVFGLGLMAVNPTLHDLAHGHAPDATPAPCGCAHSHDEEQEAGDPGDADHSCAVVLFAQGVALATPAIAPAAPPEFRSEPTSAAAKETLLTAPRYLHQPGRGPPVA